MNVKYLACYDTELNAAQQRAVAPASATVIQSVLSVLKQIGCSVEMISFSSTNAESGVSGCRYEAADGTQIKLFRSFGRRNLATRATNRIAMKLQYFLYLLFHIQKGDTVIAYHSVYYLNMLRFLKRIKDFRLILQMLEIYGDVTGSEKLRQKELRLAKTADAFIFPTEMLERIVNVDKKPAVTMLGTYQVQPDCGSSFDDEKIHVLYAGTLDPRKGGAAVAAVIAAYLPEQFCVHILGFGSEHEKQELQRVIEESNLPGHACVTYDGLLSGEEYVRFVQACHIGLSTQNPDAAFNTTSFPSKILSYLSNGLQVVSIRIPAIENSSISSCVYYYDVQNPREIAETILSVDLHDDHDGRKILLKLEENLKKDLKNILDK